MKLHHQYILEHNRKNSNISLFMRYMRSSTFCERVRFSLSNSYILFCIWQYLVGLFFLHYCYDTQYSTLRNLNNIFFRLSLLTSLVVFIGVFFYVSIYRFFAQDFSVFWFYFRYWNLVSHTLKFNYSVSVLNP